MRFGKSIMALVADCGFRRNLGTGKSLSFVRGHSSIVRSKLLIALFLVLVTGAVATVSFRYGANMSIAQEGAALAYTQAQLAFGHYKFYERIESLLERKCYEAAMTEARELKKLQIVLVSDNLHRTGSDQELIEYMKLRDPKLLEMVLTGKTPALQSYTTTCP